jgi:hypothetical protein
MKIDNMAEQSNVEISVSPHMPTALHSGCNTGARTSPICISYPIIPSQSSNLRVDAIWSQRGSEMPSNRPLSSALHTTISTSKVQVTPHDQMGSSM